MMFLLLTCMSFPIHIPRLSKNRLKNRKEPLVKFHVKRFKFGQWFGRKNCSFSIFSLGEPNNPNSSEHNGSAVNGLS